MSRRVTQPVRRALDSARVTTLWPDFHCRSIASAAIARMSKLNLRASSSFIRQTSSMTGSASSFGDVFIGEELVWSADYWKLDSVLRKASLESITDVRVRNVFAVPGEQ